MSTWGKIKIRISKYIKDNTLYYEYNTTCDAFYFIYTWIDDEQYGDGKIHTSDDYVSDEYGEAQMEAYVYHYLAMNCGGDVENFIERYIKNNRFADEWNRIEVK